MARSAASGDPLLPGDDAADDVVSERALWETWRANRDIGTKEALFNRYVSYAKALAAKMYKRRAYDDVPFEDYFQFACVGLLESIERYELDQGARFTTYSTARIDGAILDGVRRYTDAQEQLAFRRRYRQERVESLRDGVPVGTFDELVELTVGLAVGFLLQDTPSLIGNDGQDTQSNPYVTAAAGQTTRLLAAALEMLPTRERNVLTYHYLHGVPFEQIAVLYEISKGRVSQIHRNGLNALKVALTPDFRKIE